MIEKVKVIVDWDDKRLVVVSGGTEWYADAHMVMDDPVALRKLIERVKTMPPP